MIVTLAALGVSLPVTTAAPQGHAAGLTCTIAGVSAKGLKVTAAATCTNGATPVPFTSTWSSKISDLSGFSCLLGATHGSGSDFTVGLAIPHLSHAGSALPGIMEATFTITAKRGSQTATATKSWRQVTPTSHVLCGVPPAIISKVGEFPSACVFKTQPSFDGTVLKTGRVECEGDGKCNWVTGGSWKKQGTYIVRQAGDFHCSNGYQGWLNFSVEVDQTNAGCGGGTDHTSSIVVSPKWGPGVLTLAASIGTNVEKGPKPSYDNPPDADGWFGIRQEFGNAWSRVALPLTGSVDPCGSELT